jgi:hypothetical protein
MEGKNNELQNLVESWKKTLKLPGRPNEWEVKQLLSTVGIATPPGIISPPDEPSGVAARRIPAFPCVAKVCSGELIHKTEKGGVVVGIAECEAAEALDELRARFPHDDLLIEEMVSYGGFEFILGALEDLTFGPAIMVGAGGILTELYRDVTFRLAPCSKREALRMVGELRIHPVLEGYRNIYMEAGPFAEVIEKISLLAEIFVPGGNELDINPIVWAQNNAVHNNPGQNKSGPRWVALDAKAVLGS